MNGTKAQRLALIAAPYVALLVLALLGIALPLWLGSGAVVVWCALRWIIRIAFVAGAVWALRRHAHEPRPLWVYGWLGFATYEAVAALLAALVWLLDRSAQASTLIVLVALPLLALAFVPEAVVALWVALRSQLHAAYTVFPHAALTVPLFVLGGIVPYSSAMRDMLVASLLPLILAAAAAMFYTYVPPKRRWSYLYASAIVCQLAVAAGLAVTISLPILATPFLVGLGVFVLSVPSILYTVYMLCLRYASRMGWAIRIPPAFLPVGYTTDLDEPWTGTRSVLSGGEPMTANEPITSSGAFDQPPAPRGPSRLDRLYKASVVTLTVLVILAVALVVARAAVYKVHEYERGLHLRGGRFIGVKQPGWHTQIPLVDTVLIVRTNERLGYVEQIPAMTSDNVTMIVSLQYTYKVDDPEQYALQVDDPERIVFEFVQGKLRDVVNTKVMDDIMNNRAAMNLEVMDALKDKEEQYGVEFMTVQMQNASPPEEVLTAIKDRMVALQRQEQAQAEAAQRQTIADADLYVAEKEADAEAYQISTTAQADAERIRLTEAAEKEAVNALLQELEGKGVLGEKFVELLIARELKENSKWVIGGEGGTPILDLR